MIYIHTYIHIISWYINHISTSYLLDSRRVFFGRQKCFLLDNFWESALNTFQICVSATWGDTKKSSPRLQSVQSNKIQLTRITVVSGCTHFIHSATFFFNGLLCLKHRVHTKSQAACSLGPGIAELKSKASPAHIPKMRLFLWALLKPEMVWNGWPAANGGAMGHHLGIFAFEMVEKAPSSKVAGENNNMAT